MLIKNLIALTVKTLPFELFPVSFSYVYYNHEINMYQL